MAYQKILILDFSRIGDTITHDPMLRALKLKFPKALFYALTDKANFTILAHHPCIHQAYIFPRIRNFKTLCDYIYKIYWIRQQKFDLLINLYMGGASASIGYLSGIPKRLSFAKNNKLRKAYNILVDPPSTQGNWMRETHELVRPLGIDPESIWPQVKFFVHEEDRAWVPSVMPVNAGIQYAAYQLAASEAHKCWPVHKFAELAQRLYCEKHFIPVVIGSPDQMARVDEFCSLLKETPHIRLPVLPLNKIAAILEKMQVLITGDTGIMHLGFGVNVPIVAIFSNRPEYVVSPTTRKFIVFHEDENVPKHQTGQLRGRMDIPVDEVYQATEALLHML